ncbi:proline--tRNA ligase [Candidatus Fermentibacterales bacterium]|nr:proline--tRNA ligase [Candidatus Fermentibacterales bacterium]
MAENITSPRTDYARWYQDVIREAELADKAPVRGCMVIRPYGYAIWEAIRAGLDRRFRETGHENAYFPLFIPKSFIDKESEHVEGFAPELAVVTHGGGRELEEPLIVRPTSETIINYMFAKWVQSYRDLPLLINQWANVVRWELRTRPFLRTTEFLWQEGHTAHASKQEAVEEALRMLRVYESFAVEDAAIPVIPGIKTEREKFPGAVDSYSIEAMMGNGWALQAGTSHYLGTNFARAFNIQFLNEANELEYVHQTSWGVSTRMVGAVIMAHGDEHGLRLPPGLAPIQVVVVPIWRGDDTRAAVLEECQRLRARLAEDGLRVRLDDRDTQSPGFKFNYWEVRGVPLRIEIGPRDLESGSVTAARRSRPGSEGKHSLPLDEGIAAGIRRILDEIQAELYDQALERREGWTTEVSDYAELSRLIEEKGGFFRCYWDGSREDEERLQEETKATVRCIPIDQPGTSGRCVVSGRETDRIAVIARAY